jgi:hydroquinone glucosyltransferase
VEFARRLVTDHEFSVTVVTITGLSDPATDDAVLSSMPPSVTSAVLPAVALDDLPADFSFGAVMFELVRRSIPHLHDLMVGSSVAAFVCDFFGTSALSLARELGVPGYVFLPNSFAMVSLMRHVAELHRDAEAGEYRNIPEPLPFPGGPLLRHADIPDGFPDWTDPVYAYVVEEARRYARADGFLVNSFEELETTMAESFKRDAVDGVFPLVYPVGPFVRSSTSSGAGSEVVSRRARSGWTASRRARWCTSPSALAGRCPWSRRPRSPPGWRGVATGSSGSCACRAWTATPARWARSPATRTTS